MWTVPVWITVDEVDWVPLAIDDLRDHIAVSVCTTFVQISGRKAAEMLWQPC